jgi:phosphohistidine swiveling domain-containing protein
VGYILTPREALHSPAAGGKARALAAAQRAGLPVPAWFVLSSDAHEAGLTPELRAELASAVSRLCPQGETVAVRSSASDEDGVAHSFAGQLESFLSVAPADVADRVAAVWRSGFSDRILAYRREHGLSASPPAPAVLIQRMVNARTAGVAFSADPVSGRRGVAVVSAVHGLGEALVSGQSDADTWLVDRRGEILDRRVGTQGPALSDDEIRAVAALARAAARHFGRPQDIEWAIPHDSAGAGPELLQSRPITSLAARSDPEATLAVWDNSNIVESYSGVTTPLTFSFAREIYQHVYEQFCRLMGVPEGIISEREDVFRNMLGLVRGRLYYNLLNWHRVLALLPGYQVNRRFMEQMMGVKEPLPDALSAEIAQGAGSRVRDAAHLARTLAGLIANHFTLKRRVRAFYVRLNDALAPPDPPLEDRRPDELVAHYRDLRKRLLLAWDAPLVNDFFAMIFYGVLRRLSGTWCGDREGTLQNDLIAGEGGMVSAEPALRLRRLATLASGRPPLLDALTTGDRQAIEIAADQFPDFREEYRAYLEKFGERTVNELKLESSTLHDDPLPLFRAIGALGRQLAVSGGTPDAEGTGDRLRAAARAKAARALRRHPLRRVIFGWVLRHARTRVRDRENLRLERTRLFGRVRRIFLELGRRLHALDLLNDPRDVLYLEVDELLAFVDGRATTADLRGLSAVRRAEFERYERAPAPDDRFETRGPLYHGHDFRRASVTTTESGSSDERRGLGCSPGVVRGTVRVVLDPAAVDLGQRFILVAEHTDPGWIMIFPAALGVLVERGSLLSHAAIVARELGIPAVVSIPGVTRWLKDGDVVELDGSTGVIRRIGRAPGADGAE